jgi:hypothetical protein
MCPTVYTLTTPELKAFSGNPHVRLRMGRRVGEGFGAVFVLRWSSRRGLAGVN